jgi:RimJ/RimL family protein N-acetyltransferase
MRLSISATWRLRLLDESDAVELHVLIDANRVLLARWLPWAAGQTFEDTVEFIGALVDHAISGWELDRVEIRAALENRRSRAIPERLGFRLEQTLPEAETIDDRKLDSVVYAISAADWRLGST